MTESQTDLAHAKEDEPSEEEPVDEFQDKLIIVVALLTAIAAVGTTVMAVVKVLQLSVKEPGGVEVPQEEPSSPLNSTNWISIADESPWRPLHYDLQLHPHIGNRTYDGYVRINLLIQHTARKIELDAIGSIQIVSTMLHWKSFPVRVTRVLRQGEKVVIDTTHPLRVTRTYNLTLKFRGKFHAQWGLTMTQIDDEVALLMLPREMDAHVSFPCFNAPLWKTTFDVRLLTPEGFSTATTAAFNGTHRHPNGTVEHIFHRTENISAYLLSAVFTNFTSESTSLVKLWSPKSFAPFRSRILDISTQALRIQHSLLESTEQNSAFMDVVIVPNLTRVALAYSALLLLRQDAFKRRYSWQADDWKATLVQHLLSAAFENDVTPQTQRDRWIPDSLTYVYQRKVLQRMGLARMSDRLRLIGRHKAMEADDRAINASTTLRAQLIFSMISDLCPKTIESGIKRYLKTHRYGVADEPALWRALDPSGFLSRHMTTWTGHARYPVVHVLRVNDYRGDGLVLKQGWHCFHEMNCNGILVRAIPFVLHGGVLFRYPAKGASWFRGTIQRYKVAANLSSTWILLNMATVSYFRVQYDTFTTVHLIRQLRENHGVLSETSRGQFLDDLVTLAVKGVVPMDDLTTCLPYLQREGSCMVWLLYQMASAKALKQFAGRTEYKPFYEQNQAICMVLRLQPPVEPCLKVTQNEVCCAFDMCTLDTDAARSVSTNANSDGPNLT